ncbi:hypothetical protein A1O7_01700 [Cladophialophora yegresii CBS 114405]|uniref:Uncharacterized protein n=1 Tax=Cladophialophora yegresii CBS 114405 TaxID=1182544 RepID=W9X4J4_9EURO|nr:uncharacterized protein A1O7_01700 [Cladophialophora yegresii CBS 114405]EXJ65359.1 hypothetical protein A1O7_01700 [Cladophialophora yegresii CBS 114405]
MGHHKSSSKLMLEWDLRPTDSIAVRLLHGMRRDLRNTNTEDLSANATSQREEDEKDTAAVGELDKELNMMTDRALLHSARVLQEEFRQGIRSYTDVVIQ